MVEDFDEALLGLLCRDVITEVLKDVLEGHSDLGWLVFSLLVLEDALYAQVDLLEGDWLCYGLGLLLAHDIFMLIDEFISLGLNTRRFKCYKIELLYETDFYYI